VQLKTSPSPRNKTERPTVGIVYDLDFKSFPPFPHIPIIQIYIYYGKDGRWRRRKMAENNDGRRKMRKEEEERRK
jgi:hypothetical protein